MLAQAQLQPLPAAAAATAAALPGAAAPQEPSEGAGATAGNATSQPSYSSIFSAVMAMNETRNVQQIYVAIGAQGITPDLVGQSVAVPHALCHKACAVDQQPVAAAAC